MDPENRKLIQSSEFVVFNEDSVFSNRTQPKKIDRRVSFDLMRSDEDEPIDQDESVIRQIVEVDLEPPLPNPNWQEVHY